MNIVVTGKNFISPLLQQLEDANICQIISEAALVDSSLVFADTDILYATTESCLQIILDHMPATSHKRQAIIQLKDKFQCRQLLHKYYPDFEFSELELASLHLQSFGDKTMVVKPRKGFFGVGVELITPGSDLLAIQQKIMQQLQEQSHFGEHVLSAKQLIVEEFIPGSYEIAVDMFYNQ